MLLLLSHLSRIWLCVTPQMAAHEASLSLGFSRQDHWSGLPFPSPIHACMLSRFSRVRLCATLWTAAHRVAPLSTGFSRQEYWSGLPFPSPNIYTCCLLIFKCHTSAWEVLTTKAKQHGTHNIKACILCSLQAKPCFGAFSYVKTQFSRQTWWGRQFSPIFRWVNVQAEILRVLPAVITTEAELRFQTWPPVLCVFSSPSMKVKWKWLSRVSLRLHGLNSPWNSLDHNTGMGSLSLFQGIFPTHGLNPGLLHCRRILSQMSHKGSPRTLEWVAYRFSADLPNPGTELGSPVLQADSLPSALSSTIHIISLFTCFTSYCAIWAK